MKHTYLLIDLLTLLFPFLLSFHRDSNFYKTWRAFFPAVGITGFFFAGWDAWFTHMGVWGFNPRYLTGVYIGNLPLEELLFFFCIPYACVFTYCRFAGIVPVLLSQKAEQYTGLFAGVIFLATALVNADKKYTLSAFGVLAVLHILAVSAFKIKWLTRFYLVYCLLLIPFVIVNGLLTGTGLNAPVVWYNNRETMGVRILSIPVEDIFYGMDLILMNLLIFIPLSSKRITQFR